MANSTKRRRVLQAAGAGALVLVLHLAGPCSESSAQLATSAPAEGAADVAVEAAVRAAVRSVVVPDKAPGVLRLAFHDAGTYTLGGSTGGMNGSILLELGRPESGGLKRSVRVLERIRAKLDPSIKVSSADLIAVAGAEAVEICGGPHIPVRLGRIDSLVADDEGQMPGEHLTGAQLRAAFANKSFSVQEMVALLGSHTIGSKGFGEPTTFDNTYYSALLTKPWLSLPPGQMGAMIGIATDHELAEDSAAQEWIQLYAQDQNRFFRDFAAAYSKMVDLGATWRDA